jgi:hypothetical protein
MRIVRRFSIREELRLVISVKDEISIIFALSVLLRYQSGFLSVYPSRKAKDPDIGILDVTGLLFL